MTTVENIWVQYTVAADSTTSYYYINDNLVGSAPVTAKGNTVYWWGGTTPDQGFGYVANMYYYNRQLSLSEITQQFEFLLSRFY